MLNVLVAVGLSIAVSGWLLAEATPKRFSRAPARDSAVIRSTRILIALAVVELRLQTDDGRCAAWR